MLKMKAFLFVVGCLPLLFSVSEGTQDWLSHELYPCIKCLCHARSGCWIRQNCARYSISYDYWKTAGSLTVDPNDEENKTAYDKCMKDENCIVGTIIKYTEHFGINDCNCDGKFDCKDRVAIHLNGPICERPVFGPIYARRFNECAASAKVDTMLSREGDDSCSLPETV